MASLACLCQRFPKLEIRQFARLDLLPTRASLADGKLENAALSDLGRTVGAKPPLVPHFVIQAPT